MDLALVHDVRSDRVFQDALMTFHTSQCYRYQKDTKQVEIAQYLLSVSEMNLWPPTLTLSELTLLSE